MKNKKIKLVQKKKEGTKKPDVKIEILKGLKRFLVLLEKMEKEGKETESKFIKKENSLKSCQVSLNVDGLL